MRLLKNISLLILISIIVVIQSCNQNTIESISILYVPISTSSSANVNCDYFESAFKTILMREVIKDRYILREFEFLFNKLEPEYAESIVQDVRIKCLVKYLNRTDTLCITLDKRLFFKGQLMVTNYYLTEFIDNMIYY